MNPDESLRGIETEAEVEPEEKELSVCARLVLTLEQGFSTILFHITKSLDLHISYWSYDEAEDQSALHRYPQPSAGIDRSPLVLVLTPNVKTTAMDLELSGTAKFSESTIEVEETVSVHLTNKEVQAKLIFTDEQENDLRQAFNLLDYTGEGKIKAEDFRVAIKALGYEPTKEELQRMIHGVDKGDTGKLSFENFETAIMRKIMALDSDGDIMKSFRLFDIDDSGSISFENVKLVTLILGTYLTDEEIEEMIDDADKDFDGLISVAEFMKMIKNSVHIVTP